MWTGLVVGVLVGLLARELIERLLRAVGRLLRALAWVVKEVLIVSFYGAVLALACIGLVSLVAP